jgi:integrase/recombinase XerD
MNKREIFVKSFLAYCREKNLAVTTIDSYRYCIGSFLSFLEDEGIYRLEDIDHALTGMYVRNLSSSGLQPVTINHYLSAVRNFLTFLYQSNQIDRDSSQFVIQSLRAEQRLPEYMTEWEVIRLLENTNRNTSYENPKFRIFKELKGNLYMRDRALLELLYASGCRSGEILRLQKSSLNFENRTFRVMGKNGHERTAYFGKHAENWIKLYLEFVRPILKRAGSSIGQNALFLNLHGKPISRHKVSEIFERAIKIAGIERKLSPHAIRHSFGTHLVNANTPIEIVSELMGHLHIDSTVIYTHLSNRRLKKIHRIYHPSEKRTMHDIQYANESELKRVNVVIGEKQIEEMDKYTKGLQLSRSEFIRQAIDEKIYRIKKEVDEVLTL